MYAYIYLYRFWNTCLWQKIIFYVTCNLQMPTVSWYGLLERGDDFLIDSLWVLHVSECQMKNKLGPFSCRPTQCLFEHAYRKVHQLTAPWGRDTEHRQPKQNQSRGDRGKMIHGAKWNSAIFQTMMPYMTFLTQTECAFWNPPYYKKGSAKTEQS